MQPTEEELKIIAYIRAAKENRTQRKSGYLGIIMFALLIGDIILVAVNAYSSAWGVAVFMILMALMAFGNYFIRKPEKVIAERLLKEG